MVVSDSRAHHMGSAALGAEAMLSEAADGLLEPLIGA